MSARALPGWVACAGIMERRPGAHDAAPAGRSTAGWQAGHHTTLNSSRPPPRKTHAHGNQTGKQLGKRGASRPSFLGHPNPPVPAVPGGTSRGRARLGKQASPGGGVGWGQAASAPGHGQLSAGTRLCLCRAGSWEGSRVRARVVRGPRAAPKGGNTPGRHLSCRAGPFRLAASGARVGCRAPAGRALPRRGCLSLRGPVLSDRPLRQAGWLASV